MQCRDYGMIDIEKKLFGERMIAMDKSVCDGQGRILYRVSEAAAMCSVSRSGFYNLLAKGQIPRVYVGRSIRISRKWLDSYIDSQLRAHEEAAGGNGAGA